MDVSVEDQEVIIPEEDTVVVSNADEAMSAHNKALVHIDSIAHHYIALGLYLVKIDQESAWKYLGFDSFGAYCAAPRESGGLGLSKRWRQTCMQVTRKWHLELGVPLNELLLAQRSNLILLVSDVNEKNVEEALADAKALGFEDIRKNRDEGKYRGKEIKIEVSPESPAVERHPTLGELYMRAVRLLPDNFASGFVVGQAEIVFSGIADAKMIRATEDNNKAAEGACRVYGLTKCVVPEEGELWIVQRNSEFLVDRINEMLAAGKKDSEEWHIYRARICGIKEKNIDKNYHLRGLRQV